MDIVLAPGLQGHTQQTAHLNFMLGVRDFRAAVMGSDYVRGEEGEEKQEEDKEEGREERKEKMQRPHLSWGG